MEKKPKNEKVVDEWTGDPVSGRHWILHPEQVVVHYLNKEMQQAKTVGDKQKQDDLKRLIGHVLQKGGEQYDSTT